MSDAFICRRGGTGAGGELTVNAPAGVTVTAVHSTTGKSYTKTANADGVAVFKGLPEGTYSVTISDGTTTTEPVSVGVAYKAETTVAFFQATINVTYPEGSTCTCSDGTTTLTAPDTTGTWACVVPNAGTWTVTATDGEDADTLDVEITAAGQNESVVLAYKLWIFKAGQGDVTPLVIWRETYISISKTSDNIRLRNNSSESNNRFFGIYTGEKIDLTPYSKLRMTANFSEVKNTRLAVKRITPTSTGAINSTGVAQLNLTTGEQTFTLDITDVAETLYCLVQGTGASGTPCTQGVITNIWLEK